MEIITIQEGFVALSGIEIQCADKEHRKFTLMISNDIKSGNMEINFLPVNRGLQDQLEPDFQITIKKGQTGFTRKRGKIKGFYEHLCSMLPWGQIEEQKPVKINSINHKATWQFNACDAKARLTIPFGANTWDLNNLDENGDYIKK